MKNHLLNNNKTKKIDFISKKKNVISSDIDNKKKSNQSPQKSDNKKEFSKNDKNISTNNQQIISSKENNLKFSNNTTIKSSLINPNNININTKKNDKLTEIKNSDTSVIQPINSNNQPQVINIVINENKEDLKIVEEDNNKMNEKNSSPLKNNLLLHTSYCGNINSQLNENDKKLKSSLQAYKDINKKNDNTSLNTLYKVRSILLNLLKDKEQDLEYSKFITEKKLKYMIKNKEKSEMRMKVLESDLKAVEIRKEELEKQLGELYCFYDEEELKEDIKRFENSNEVKSGKFSKTLEQLETMKKMLPLVSEFGKVKEKRTKILSEKKELGKIIKNSGQTIVTLNNYYKNIKKKINEQINNNI